MQCCLAAAAEFAKIFVNAFTFPSSSIVCRRVQELHLSLTWMEAAKVRTKRTYFFGWGTILYLLLELDASFLQLPLKIIYLEKIMLAKTNTTSMKTGEINQQILRWAFIIKTNRPCQTLAEFGGLARPV